MTLLLLVSEFIKFPQSGVVRKTAATQLRRLAAPQQSGFGLYTMDVTAYIDIRLQAATGHLSLISW